jgi:hypothetical protein
MAIERCKHDTPTLEPKAGDGAHLASCWVTS